MAREKSTTTKVTAGCFDCNGAVPMWTERNGMMLAARHHDQTGHPTWADTFLTVRFGEAGPAHPDLFPHEAQS